MMRIHDLYLITNLITKEIYVGQAVNAHKRWIAHKSNANSPRQKQLVDRKIQEYDPKNFTMCILAQVMEENTITRKETGIMERVLIKQYNCNDPKIGYNKSIGGEENPFYGKTHNENTKQKMRKFSLEEEKKICRLYVEEKITAAKISEKFKCSRSGIGHILNRNGIENRKVDPHYKRQNLFSQDQDKQIYDLYTKQNISVNELSKTFGCHENTIRKAFKRQMALVK